MDMNRLLFSLSWDLLKASKAWTGVVMGAGNGWRCKKCGAGEEYWTGCGMASFNVEETRNRIAKGEFGKLARQLLSEDFPLQVGTVDEKVFFRCSTCSKLVEGMK